MRILLDPNIIIDAMAGRPPWNEAAEQIILQAADGGIDIFVTASMITDIYYIVNKTYHSHRKTKKILSQLLSLVNVLQVTEEDCVASLSSPISDYEDAVVEQVAKRAGMDIIITRNLEDFSQGTIEVKHPLDYMG